MPDAALLQRSPSRTPLLSLSHLPLDNMAGTTPLHIACRDGRAEEVKMLLENGASANMADEDGWTPLYIAYKNDHVDVMELLLEHIVSMRNAPTQKEIEKSILMRGAYQCSVNEITMLLLGTGSSGYVGPASVLDLIPNASRYSFMAIMMFLLGRRPSGYVVPDFVEELRLAGM